jgi:ABC-type bacteriocin/lantibiotic exporter with double-glycine peptidase domain
MEINPAKTENNENTRTSVVKKTPTFVVDYWNNVLDKSLKGFIVGGASSYILIGRFKLGAVLGFGISAGYFNSDLMKIFKFYSETYNLNSNAKGKDDIL